MRLHLIYELNLGKAAKMLRPLLNVMPKYKMKHSIQVAKNLKKAGAGDVGVYSGILHDYLERGGNISDLHYHINELGLPPEVSKIVTAMTSDKDYNNSDNPPLEHMQSVLPTIADRDIKNIIVLAKIADRIDNIKKRIREKGKIGNRYLPKSNALINYLITQYAGDYRPLSKLLKKYGNLVSQ